MSLMVSKANKLYEGKAKIIYSTDNPEYLIQYFKDDTTAFNAAKRGIIHDKGILNNKISAKIFEFLKSQGIPTHYERILNDREVLVKKVKIIPIEVVVRNRAAGSLCRRLGFPEGQKFSSPILEYCYKDDVLNDPLINDDHIQALDLATREEIENIKTYTLKINELLSQFFLLIRLELIDFKLEFGQYQNQLLLADEISPDTCRLSEVGTGKSFDKDRFRRDLGNVEEAYQEVLSRVSQ